MLKETFKQVGLIGLDILKALVQEVGFSLFSSLLWGFLIGVLLVLILRRRVIPKREGKRKWLNRLYYILLIFMSTLAYSAYSCLSKIEGKAQAYVSAGLESSRPEIDSFEVVLKEGRTELNQKIENAEKSLAQIAALQTFLRLYSGKEASAAIGEIINEHVNVVMLKETTEILKIWNSSDKALADVLNAWCQNKAHLLFKPYYTMIYLMVFIALIIPGIEIFLWKRKLAKQAKIQASASNSPGNQSI